MSPRPIAWILILGIGIFLGGVRYMHAAAADQSPEAGLESGKTAPVAPADISGSGAPMDCERILAALEQQKNMISREMGQIKREMAALRSDLEKPGLRDIVAGLGYIFGLAGIALFWMRRKPPTP